MVEKLTSSSPMGPESMSDKEVQTDFPSGMLEEYVWENRRRVLKLLRYPKYSLSHGQGNKFEDMPFNVTDSFVKPSNISGRSTTALRPKMKLGDSLSSSSDRISPPLQHTKISNTSPVHNQSTQPFPGPQNILDSSDLFRKHQKGYFKNLPKSRNTYSQSFDSTDISSINFKSSLRKPPRNLSLADTNDNESALQANKELDRKQIIDSRGNRMRVFSECDAKKSKGHKTGSCLSLGMNRRAMHI